MKRSYLSRQREHQVKSVCRRKVLGTVKAQKGVWDCRIVIKGEDGRK